MILLEINYSIVSAIKAKSGAVQVRIVILIAILALARKLILLDYKSVGADVLIALGGLSLSLGVLYWLLADSDHRRRPQSAPPSTVETPP
ncbi:MAG: phosphate-starvation-inducible PsiE family protein [Aestuariivirga sp.]